ncbi:MAG: DUF3810 domain-containing protein [Acutalibacteraceae bacterium]
MDTNESHFTLPETPKKPKLSVRLKQKGILRPYTVATAVVFGCAVLVYVLARFWTAFAEFWARYPSQGLRFILAKLTSWIPFSLAEALILSLPVLAAAYIIYSNRALNRSDSPRAFWSCLMPLICAIFLLLSYFCLAFGPCYFRNGLDTNLGFKREAVSAEDLRDCAVWLSGEIEAIEDQIAYGASGHSYMPYSYYEMTGKLNDAFAAYAEKADYISSFRASVKPVVLSVPMTYTHISGVYTFFTGEANVNVNFPDFCTPYTTAHEMSHQRGIAREDEANFVAFLVCMESDDVYIRYSALVNLLQYVSSALSRADSELYATVYRGHYSSALRSELSAYSKFFDEYRQSTASRWSARSTTRFAVAGTDAGHPELWAGGRSVCRLLQIRAC